MRSWRVSTGVCAIVLLVFGISSGAPPAKVTTDVASDEPKVEPKADGAKVSPTPKAGKPKSAFSNRQEERHLLAGATDESEKAVAAALSWLARHQNPDGGWGCMSFKTNCKDRSCAVHVEKKTEEYPMAATAFGVLPFLGAGQTHRSKGQYKVVVNKGLDWIEKHQNPKNGCLGTTTMYEHGLATIALCEAYGMSKDATLKLRAQAALNFIMDAQNDASGGWHYTPNPKTLGDTSVLGWQLTALKSGEMAGLQVDPKTLKKAQLFLWSVAKGKSGGLFTYMPDTPPTPTMSAVGMLCNQHLGMKQDDPAMIEGMEYLSGSLSTVEKNSYFLYYATQAMRNVHGQEWDKWNAHTQRWLIDNQTKADCAAGSWDPKGNAHTVGPVMMTSLCALTLEVYYRYLPVYLTDDKEAKDDLK